MKGGKYELGKTHEKKQTAESMQRKIYKYDRRRERQ